MNNLTVNSLSGDANGYRHPNLNLCNDPAYRNGFLLRGDWFGNNIDDYDVKDANGQLRQDKIDIHNNVYLHTLPDIFHRGTRYEFQAGSSLYEQGWLRNWESDATNDDPKRPGKSNYISQDQIGRAHV